MSLFLVSFLGFAALVKPSPHPRFNSSHFSWQNTKALLAFGDSYTYVQGVYGWPNSSFIGSTLTPTFTPEQLLNNDIVQNQTGSSAGGPNWVEYLTGCGLKTEKPSDCTGEDQKQLWDFAFGGADVSARYLPLHHNYTVDLDAQGASFAKQAYPYLPVGPDETLTAIYIGINDVNDSKNNASISSFPAFYAQIITTLFENVEILYNLGYRDYLFMNLPPYDRSPPNVVAAAQNKTVSPSALQISQWNEQLANSSDTFRETHADTNVFLFDVDGLLNKILDDPSPYGIVNTTGYCPSYNWPNIATDYALYGCLPISEYFWYNTGHISYRVHQILSDAVRDFLDAAGRCER